MTETAPSASPSSPGYSRAFEAFVDGDDDLLGLLAYALYKRGIQEARAAGRPAPPSEQRFPSNADKSAFRSLAQNLLDTFAESTLQQAQENILDRGIRPELKTVQDAVKAHVDRRTRFWPAILVNVVAWIISLVLTVIFAAAITSPSWIGPVREQIGLATPSQPSRTPVERQPGQ